MTNRTYIFLCAVATLGMSRALLHAQIIVPPLPRQSVKIADGTYFRFSTLPVIAPAVVEVVRPGSTESVTVALDRIASCSVGPPPAEAVIAGSLAGHGMLCPLARPSGATEVLGYVPLPFEPASVAHRSGVWAAMSTDGGFWAACATSNAPSAAPFIPGASAWFVVATAAELGAVPGIRMHAGVGANGSISSRVGLEGNRLWRQVGGGFVPIPPLTGLVSHVLNVETPVILGRPLQVSSNGVFGPIHLESSTGMTTPPIGSIQANGATALVPGTGPWFESGQLYRLVAANARSAWFMPYPVVPAGFAASGLTLAPIEVAAHRVRLEEGRFMARSRLHLQELPTDERTLATVALVQRGNTDLPNTRLRNGVVWLEPEAALRQEFLVHPRRQDYALAGPVPLVRGAQQVNDRVFVQLIVLDGTTPIAATSIAVLRILPDLGSRVGKPGFTEGQLLGMVQGLWARQGVADLATLCEQLMGPN